MKVFKEITEKNETVLEGVPWGYKDVGNIT